MKKINFKGILATLIGLSLCNNIFYIFNKNNFYINISNVISIIGLLYILIYEKEKFWENFRLVDRTFKLFIAISILSIVPAVISLSGDLSVLSSYFNGIPTLILLFIEYYVIICFHEQKKNMLNGIKIGFILNIIVCVIQYAYFINGKVFTLFYQMFPTPSFQVCGKYYVLNAMSNISTTLKVYIYRAQGLFIETSYFTTFIVGAALLSLKRFNNTFLKVIFTAILCYLCILSESGNFIIFVIMTLLYYLIIWIKKKNGKIKRKNMIIIPIALLTICGFIIYASKDESLSNSINRTILSANISDSGNSSRKRTIIEGVELVRKYPLGIGYNMTSKIFSMEYPTEIHSYIFSTLIVNQLELGFIGNLIYLIFALKFIIKILKYSKDEEDIMIAISVLGLFLCQCSNGINYWNIQYIIGMYALANITYNDLKNKLQTKY